MHDNAAAVVREGDVFHVAAEGLGQVLAGSSVEGKRFTAKGAGPTVLGFVGDAEDGGQQRDAKIAVGFERGMAKILPHGVFEDAARISDAGGRLVQGSAAQ